MRRLAMSAVALCCALGVPFGARAAGASPGGSCSSQPDVATCDVDADLIPDAIEEQICGLVTCADGSEDIDADGVPDWLEIEVCGDARCVDPVVDTDGLGIPDWLEVLTCGSSTCADGAEDADADGLGDWLEWLSCGSATCADVGDDLDRNGVADGEELARIERVASTTTLARTPDGPLPFTGGDAVSILSVAAAAVGLGLIVRVAARRRMVRP